MDAAETATELGASELSVSTAAVDMAGTAAESELSFLRGGCHTVQCSAVVDFTSVIQCQMLSHCHLAAVHNAATAAELGASELSFARR